MIGEINNQSIIDMHALNIICLRQPVDHLCKCFLHSNEKQTNRKYLFIFLENSKKKVAIERVILIR